MIKPINNLQKWTSKRAEQLAASARIIPAVMGDLQGVTLDLAQPLNSWVTIDGNKPLSVLNTSVPNQPGLPVLLGYHPGDTTLRVLRVDQAYNTRQFEGMPDHAYRHQSGGADTLFSWIQQLMPWNVLPSIEEVSALLKVKVFRTNMYYPSTETYEEGSVQEVDLTSYVPHDIGVRFILLQVSKVGVITVKVGSIVPTFDDLTVANVPLPDNENVPLASIRMYYGQTRICAGDDETNDIADWRSLGLLGVLEGSGSSSDGGQGGVLFWDAGGGITYSETPEPLSLFTIASNTLSNDGDCIIFTWAGETSGLSEEVNDNKELLWYFDEEVIFSSNGFGFFIRGSWAVEIIFLRISDSETRIKTSVSSNGLCYTGLTILTVDFTLEHSIALGAVIGTNIFDGYVRVSMGVGILDLVGAAGGGGSGPAGGSGQIQYKQSGLFAASPDLMWDNVSKILRVGPSAATPLTTVLADAYGVLVYNRNVANGVTVASFRDDGLLNGPTFRGLASNGVTGDTETESWEAIQTGRRLVSFLGQGFAGNLDSAGYVITGGRLSLRASQDWTPGAEGVGQAGSNWIITVIPNNSITEVDGFTFTGEYNRTHFPFQIPEIAEPATPDSGYSVFWIDITTKHLFKKDSTGYVTDLDSGGVGGGFVESVEGDGVDNTDPVNPILNWPTASDLGAEITSRKGATNGYAGLDAGGKVPAAQLPSYVDDVIEATNFAALPGTGETGKIYVTRDDNLTYRWTGSVYVPLSGGVLGNTDDLTEGTTNLYFTTTRVRSTLLTGLSLVTLQTIAATDTFLQALGYLQAQVTAAKFSTINFVMDGGSAIIATGIKGDLVVDFDCTIVGVTLLANASGSIVVDIWKDSYSNYPPVVGDSITASAKPTISSAIKSQNTTLTGWTTSITSGDILRINVDSVTVIQRCTLSLKVRRP